MFRYVGGVFIDSTHNSLTECMGPHVITEVITNTIELTMQTTLLLLALIYTTIVVNCRASIL
mgnify:CR=1 FL=1